MKYNDVRASTIIGWDENDQILFASVKRDAAHDFNPRINFGEIADQFRMSGATVLELLDGGGSTVMAHCDSFGNNINHGVVGVPGSRHSEFQSSVLGRYVDNYVVINLNP